MLSDWVSMLAAILLNMDELLNAQVSVMENCFVLTRCVAFSCIVLKHVLQSMLIMTS